MDFVKVQALRNDFIVFDGQFEPDPYDTKRWCDRRTGIGADGILVISQGATDHINMRYWNADGSEAEMCGNGLRCVARLAYERRWVSGPDFVVDTAAGAHPVSVRPDTVVAFVGVPTRSRADTFQVAGHDVYPFAIGNPHAVLFVDDVATADVEGTGRLIENDPLFPDRTNVEFVEVLDEGGIRVRVWERGVGETPASGTGATASAYIAHEAAGIEAPVLVHLTGGSLMISLDDAGAWMEGPATTVFTGSVG